MKGSLIIVGFFVLGALCGVYHLIPYDFTQSKLSFYALCALMFSVGVSVGNDPQTLRNFRSLNPRLIFLPVMTILGTLAGCAVVSLFLSHRSVTDCMAVGAGFGYYSLSSIFITEYKGPELGTIAFCPVASTLVWQSSPYFCRRSHYDGYNITHHHPLFRSKLRSGFYISRLCSGLQRTFSCDSFLFYLK